MRNPNGTVKSTVWAASKMRAASFTFDNNRIKRHRDLALSNGTAPEARVGPTQIDMYLRNPSGSLTSTEEVAADMSKDGLYLEKHRIEAWLAAATGIRRKATKTDIDIYLHKPGGTDKTIRELEKDMHADGFYVDGNDIALQRFKAKVTDNRLRKRT